MKTVKIRWRPRPPLPPAAEAFPSTPQQRPPHLLNRGATLIAHNIVHDYGAV